MKEWEVRACEWQADLFERSISVFSCGSQYFLFRFLQSDIAFDVDSMNPLDPLPAVPEAFGSLLSQFPSLSGKKGPKADAKTMRYIGYLSRAYILKKKRTSSALLRDISTEKLVSLYDVYHTFDIDYAVERLDELIQEEKPRSSDKELFRRVFGF